MLRYFIFLVVLFSTNYLYAQKSKTEIGIQFLKVESVMPGSEIQLYGKEGLTNIRRTSIQSLLYSQHTSDFQLGTFYVNKVRTKGVHVPDLILKRRIIHNLWLKANSSIYYTKQYAENLSLNHGTLIEDYRIYDKNESV